MLIFFYDICCINVLTASKNSVRECVLFTFLLAEWIRVIRGVIFLHSNIQGVPSSELSSGWEWVEDWHVDKTSVESADGWVYASDPEHLKWPYSFNDSDFVNYARQRRWIRNRKQILGDTMRHISIGSLNPGDTAPLPLLSVTRPDLCYILQLRPKNVSDPSEYSWSTVVDRHSQSPVSSEPEECSEICVSTLTESERLLCCTQTTGNSSRIGQRLWFCVSIKATEIGRDIHSDPIQDWNIVFTSPLSITNFLPMSAEFSVLEKQSSGQFFDCSRGIFNPGETVKVYNADIRNPLYFSLLPQGGWQPIHV